MANPNLRGEQLQNILLQHTPSHQKESVIQELKKSSAFLTMARKKDLTKKANVKSFLDDGMC